MGGLPTYSCVCSRFTLLATAMQNTHHWFMFTLLKYGTKDNRDKSLLVILCVQSSYSYIFICQAFSKRILLSMKTMLFFSSIILLAVFHEGKIVQAESMNGELCVPALLSIIIN